MIEHESMAREIAADRSVGVGTESLFSRKMFNEGWEAAMDYRLEKITTIANAAIDDHGIESMALEAALSEILSCSAPRAIKL